MPHPNDPPPARSTLRGLLLLNAALLAVLAAVTFGPAAVGQARVPGEYTMAAGGANGANAGIVYVVDVRNLELVAVTYDYNTTKLNGIGYRSLAGDISTVMHRRPGN